MVADTPGAAGTGGLVITSMDAAMYDGDYMVIVGLADATAAEFGGVYLLDEGGRGFAGRLDCNAECSRIGPPLIRGRGRAPE